MLFCAFVSFFLSFCPLYPLRTFISFVLMSLIPLQHTTQTFIHPAGFEPAIPASDRLQTHALERSATWIGKLSSYLGLLKLLLCMLFNI